MSLLTSPAESGRSHIRQTRRIAGWQKDKPHPFLPVHSCIHVRQQT